jgi:hypothetical protein
MLDGLSTGEETTPTTSSDICDTATTALRSNRRAG